MCTLWCSCTCTRGEGEPSLLYSNLFALVCVCFWSQRRLKTWVVSDVFPSRSFLSHIFSMVEAPQRQGHHSKTLAQDTNASAFLHLLLSLSPRFLPLSPFGGCISRVCCGCVRSACVSGVYMGGLCTRTHALWLFFLSHSVRPFLRHASCCIICLAILSILFSSVSLLCSVPVIAFSILFFALVIFRVVRFDSPLFL